MIPEAGAGDHVRHEADLQADPTNDGAQGDMVVYLSTPHGLASHCHNNSRQVHKYFFKLNIFVGAAIVDKL